MILGPEVGITDLLDYEITEKLKTEQEQKKSGKKGFHPLRPSSAGHCSRKLALELMEYRGKAFYNKPILEPHVYRLFDLGHAIESNILKHFQLIKVFEQKYKQQTMTLFELSRGKADLQNELIEGSCDFVFFSSKFRCIGDVKSKKDGFSSYKSSKWDEELEKFSMMSSLQKVSETSFYADSLEAFIEELGDDWLVDNLLQLNLYAISDFMQERKIDFAFLLRYNKNDSRIMEVRFRPSREVFNATKEKFQTITKLIDNDTIPDSCEFNFGSIRNAFCDCHKMLPYLDADPIKAYFKSLPKKIWPVDVTGRKDAANLSSLYRTYLNGIKAAKQREEAEQEIVKIFTQEKISKVKFDDGAIYEIKLLKSPREHYEMRRSK